MPLLQIAEFLQLQILSACARGSGKQSIGDVLLTFLVLYAITQLFWIVKVLQVTNRNKIGELWTIKSSHCDEYTHALKIQSYKKSAIRSILQIAFPFKDFVTRARRRTQV